MSPSEAQKYLVSLGTRELSHQGHLVFSTVYIFCKKCMADLDHGLRTPGALYPTGYQKRTGQFLRSLHVYSIDNFVAF